MACGRLILLLLALLALLALLILLILLLLLLLLLRLLPSTRRCTRRRPRRLPRIRRIMPANPMRHRHRNEPLVVRRRRLLNRNEALALTTRWLPPILLPLLLPLHDIPLRSGITPLQLGHKGRNGRGIHLVHSRGRDKGLCRRDVLLLLLMLNMLIRSLILLRALVLALILTMLRMLRKIPPLGTNRVVLRADRAGSGSRSRSGSRIPLTLGLGLSMTLLVCGVILRVTLPRTLPRRRRRSLSLSGIPIRLERSRRLGRSRSLSRVNTARAQARSRGLLRRIAGRLLQGRIHRLGVLHATTGARGDAHVGHGGAEGVGVVMRLRRRRSRAVGMRRPAMLGIGMVLPRAAIWLLLLLRRMLRVLRVLLLLSGVCVLRLRWIRIAAAVVLLLLLLLLLLRVVRHGDCSRRRRRQSCARSRVMGKCQDARNSVLGWATNATRKGERQFQSSSGLWLGLDPNRARAEVACSRV